MKLILHNVKVCLDKYLVFDKSKSIALDVVGYVDSDYDGDLDFRCFISVYIFTLYMGAIF